MPSIIPGPDSRFWPWFDEQIRTLKKKLAACDLFDETMADKAATNPWYALGPMVYLFWMITIVTGLVLIIWYIPNTSRAYDSIIHLTHEIPLGWLIRGCHKYGADAVIIAATMRVYRLYFTGEYKEKELAWAISIIVLLIMMFSGLTGYLLIWNQRAFWASKVFATFPTYLDQIPLVKETHFGMTQAQFMLGGMAIGEATMTRFYAGHFMLSMFSLIAVEAYFLRTGLRRINLSWLGIGICVLMLVVTTILIPVELGSRANRGETPLPILSDWYFLGLYQMMKEMKPLWAVIGTLVIPAVALAMPALDRAKGVPTTKRPLFMAVGVGALIWWLALSFMIIANWAQITTDPPKIWASFQLFIFVGACFEYRAVGYSRRKVFRYCVMTLLAWLVTFGIYAGWTRFRQPAHAGAYYPAFMDRIVSEENVRVRDENNNQYSGDDEDAIVDDIRNALARPIIKVWMVPASPGDEQREKLLSEHRSVRGWWTLMTFILAISGLAATGMTPREGIESEVYPSRTDRGKRIKGLAPDEKKR